jgi:hypothetical protein
MASAGMIALARQKGRKKRGPTSVEDEQVSRSHVIKNGCTATLAMLPGEDVAQYEARRVSWIKTYGPSNAVELAQVERAVYVSLQLERVSRAQSAHLCMQSVTAAKARLDREATETIELSLDLFRPTWEFRWGSPDLSSSAAETTGSARPRDEPVHPALIGGRLETMADGCRWLCHEWKELGAILDEGQAWQSTHCFKAIRLLGMHPSSVVDLGEIARFLRTCQALTAEASELASDTWKLLAPADAERGLQSLLTVLESIPGPVDADAARQELNSIVNEQVERLEDNIETYDEITECEVALRPHSSAFDFSAEGERMRRYELALRRFLIRFADEMDRKRAARGPEQRALGSKPYRIRDSSPLDPDIAWHALADATRRSNEIDKVDAIANGAETSKSDSSRTPRREMPARASEFRRNEPSGEVERVVDAVRNEPNGGAAESTRQNEPRDAAAGGADLTSGAAIGVAAARPDGPTAPVEVIRRHQVGCATVTRLSQAALLEGPRRGSRRERLAQRRELSRKER